MSSKTVRIRKSGIREYAMAYHRKQFEKAVTEMQRAPDARSRDAEIIRAAVHREMAEFWESVELIGNAGETG